jgi:hypothetical protein
MPYTKKERREAVKEHLEKLISQIHSYDMADWDGEANYAISYLVARIFAPFGKWRYHFIARAYAVFFAAAAEFYRRIAAPYEDEAIEKNGDIALYERDDPPV